MCCFDGFVFILMYVWLSRVVFSDVVRGLGALGVLLGVILVEMPVLFLDVLI